VGIRTIIETGATLDGVVCMGADFYETAAQRAANRAVGVPNVGIGSGTIVRRAIIDKNARIGENCRIGIDPRDRPDQDAENWSIRSGIIVIHKNGVLDPGTVI
jgi:glucose-1-phosphate adenylyltransferase